MLWAAVLLLLSQAPIPPIPPVPPVSSDGGGFLGIPTALWNLLIAAVLGFLLDRARRASDKAAAAAAVEAEKVKMELVIKGKQLELAILAAAKEAAGKVEEVKTTLVTTSKQQEEHAATADKKLDHITMLTNSGMTELRKELQQATETILRLEKERSKEAGKKDEPDPPAVHPPEDRWP